MSSILGVFDFIILTVSFSALTVCLLVHKAKRSNTFLFFGIYFITQILLELDIRISEVDTPLTQLINRFFEKQLFTVTMKPLLYGVILSAVLLSALSILDEKTRPVYFVAPGAILLWMFISPTITVPNLKLYWIYLLPCEIFYFSIALLVLKRIARRPDEDFHPTLKVALKLIMVFSVIIAVEDIFFREYYVPLNVDHDNFLFASVAGLKERNFSENVLNIILAILAIHAGGEILTETRHKDHDDDAGEKDFADEFNTNEFARYLGLSPREGDVLPLLLSNMDINQISQVLIISDGTVKSHTHNIYQKAGVNNRSGLIKLAAEFRSSRQ